MIQFVQLHLSIVPSPIGKPADLTTAHMVPVLHSPSSSWRDRLESDFRCGCDVSHRTECASARAKKNPLNGARASSRVLGRMARRTSALAPSAYRLAPYRSSSLAVPARSHAAREYAREDYFFIRSPRSFTVHSQSVTSTPPPIS